MTVNPNHSSALPARFQSFSPAPSSPQRHHIVTSATADSAKLRNEIGCEGAFTVCVCVCVVAVVVFYNVSILLQILQTQMSLITQYFNKIDLTALPFKGRCPR